MRQSELIMQVTRVTDQLLRQCPEWHQVITETPLFLTANCNGIRRAEWEQYLQTLRKMLSNWRKT